MSPRPPVALFFLFALALAVAACSAPATAPAASAPAPAAAVEQATAAPASTTVQPPAEAAGAPAATEPAAATAAATTTAGAEGTAAVTTTLASTPANTAPAAGDVIRLVLVPDGTEARFRVREQLAGRDLPSDAIGTTSAVTGTIAIQSDGKLVPGASRFVVDLSTLKTDQSRRDNYIKRNTLQTEQYPEAVFEPAAVEGLPSPLPTSGDVSFQLAGNLTIHGVTKPVTWRATGRISGQDLSGTAIAQDLTFADFGMSQPRVMMVLSVEDKIRLEIDFHLTRQQ